MSYYLAKVLATVGITDKRTQNEVNLGLSCWNLVTGVTGAFLTKKLPRRTQYLIAFCGMTILFACWTGASAVSISLSRLCLLAFGPANNR